MLTHINIHTKTHDAWIFHIKHQPPSTFHNFNKTRFQLILPDGNHNVTKNLTGHRLHIEGPQIYQMNSRINSFQNMCDMLWANNDRLARKIDFLHKKCTSKSPILVDMNLGYLTLEGPGRQTVNTKSTSGLPLKTYGVLRFNLAMWEVGGIKIERTLKPTTFFPWDTEFGEKVIFL